MRNSEVMNSLSRTFHRTGLQLKKHSPEIMVVAGVIGTVASAVMACHATTKLQTVLEENKKNIEAARNTGAPESTEHKKALATAYAKTGWDIGKLYIPAIALGALSITSILASHNILHKRNVALAAAYTTVSTGFKEYSSRVIKRFGQELDKELRYNIQEKEVEEVVVHEDGKQEVVKKTVKTAEPSIYARFFDDGCTGWEKNSEFNLMYLRHQQNYANELLRSRGHVFLNEVYDMLGIPRTVAGQHVGWVYDNPKGDNYIDFGIYDLDNEAKRDFVNGYERTIILDFNVDGDILSLI